MGAGGARSRRSILQRSVPDRGTGSQDPSEPSGLVDRERTGPASPAAGSDGRGHLWHFVEKPRTYLAYYAGCGRGAAEG